MKHLFLCVCWHCLHTIQQGLCNDKVSVRPSVSPICWSLSAGLLLQAGRAGVISQLIVAAAEHGRRHLGANATVSCGQLTYIAEHKLVRICTWITCSIKSIGCWHCRTDLKEQLAFHAVRMKKDDVGLVFKLDGDLCKYLLMSMCLTINKLVAKKGYLYFELKSRALITGWGHRLCFNALTLFIKWQEMHPSGLYKTCATYPQRFLPD